MHDLTELRAASDSWPVPAHDLETVKNRARTLVRRRRTVTYGFTALFLVAVIAVGLTWSRTLGKDNFQIRPAGETQEGARAATFAFHALLETTDFTNPDIGSYDYKSVDQTGPSEWRVHFTVGSDPQEIQQLLESRRMAVQELLENGRDPKSRSVEALRDNIRELEAGYKIAVFVGGPFDFNLTTQQDGQVLQVSGVNGPFPEDAKDDLLAFEETVGEIPAQGTEHWHVRARIGKHGNVSLKAATFWTGPIPSDYRETCLLSFVDNEGETVFTQQESGNFAPQTDEAPPSEDLRDWGFGSSGGRVPDRLLDRDDLHGEINCHPLDGDGWVAIGEAEIKPVKDEFSIASAEPLDPNRHVIVSSDIVYKGDPGIESICIARVFDEQYYLQMYSDVAADVGTIWATAFEHYRVHGAKEGRNPSAYFNEIWYRQQYADVAADIGTLWTSGVEHYVRHGAMEGRNPSLDFNEAYYLQNNPDVAAALGQPWLCGLEHFLRHGQFEGRQPKA